MASPPVVEYRQRISPDTASGAGFANARPVEFMSGGATGEDYTRAGALLKQGAWDLRAANEEEARAWSADVMAKARLEWTTHFLDRQTKAPPGAPGFTPALLEDFDKYVDKTVESAGTDISKNFIRDRLLDFRTSLGESSLAFEAKARIDHRSDQFTSAIQTTQKLMNTDPGQYKIALAEQLAVIDASDMPPVQKSAMRQKAIDDISLAATWSQIQRSPKDFMDSIGFGQPDHAMGGKTRKSSGDLAGLTGNTAFDALPFDKRVHMFESAVRLKAQNDADADRVVKEQAKTLSDNAMKEGWNRLFSGKLTNAYIEEIRPLLNPSEYHSLLVAKKGEGGGQKTDPGTYRKLQELIYSDPKEAEKFAFTAHKAGLLSNEHLSSGLTRARELDRSEGPKSEYERSRRFIVGSLDPGQMVPDPVGKSRMAEALDTFDRWVDAGGGKRTDDEIQKRGREVVDQYKMIDLSQTALALPSPRSGPIRRNVADRVGMQQDILAAARKADQKRSSGDLSEADYKLEMDILNRWRKVATAPLPAQGPKK